MKQVWYKFDKAKGFRQKRPPIRKWVVVQLTPREPHKVEFGVELKPGVPGLMASYPPGLAVGYRKDAAGDKSCPYFVIPGIGGEVSAWCDCLPDDFQPPGAYHTLEKNNWQNYQQTKVLWSCLDVT